MTSTAPGAVVAIDFAGALSDPTTFVLDSPTRGVLDSTDFTLADTALELIAGLLTVTTQAGRSSMYDAPTPGTLTATFSDPAGNLDRLNASSPYWPNVQPRRRLALTATLGSLTTPIWAGYVDDIGRDQDGINAIATVTAVDALGLLALITAIPNNGAAHRPAELASTRLRWLFSLIGLPVDEGTVADGGTVAASDLSGVNALEAAKRVELADAGRLWISPAGAWCYRSVRAITPGPATVEALDIAADDTTTASPLLESVLSSPLSSPYLSGLDTFDLGVSTVIPPDIADIDIPNLPADGDAGWTSATFADTGLPYTLLSDQTAHAPGSTQSAGLQRFGVWSDAGFAGYLYRLTYELSDLPAPADDLTGLLFTRGWAWRPMSDAPINYTPDFGDYVLHQNAPFAFFSGGPDTITTPDGELGAYFDQLPYFDVGFTPLTHYIAGAPFSSVMARYWNSVTVQRAGGTPQTSEDADAIGQFGRQAPSPFTDLPLATDDDALELANRIRLRAQSLDPRPVDVEIPFDQWLATAGFGGAVCTPAYVIDHLAALGASQGLRGRVYVNNGRGDPWADGAQDAGDGIIDSIRHAAGPGRWSTVVGFSPAFPLGLTFATLDALELDSGSGSTSARLAFT